jgi:rhomboid protease GluP
MTESIVDLPQSPQKQYTSYEVLRQTWLTRKPHANASLVAIVSTLVLALIALAYLIDLGGVAKYLDASGASVYGRHEYWRAWTTVFAHGDPGHLFSNLLLFFTLGYFLNGYFGARLFPWAALFWGGITNLVVLKTYEPEITLVGASGVVYWMGGVWLVLYFSLSRQKNLLHRFVRSFGVAILIFMPSGTFEPHVSHRTHLIGFLLGLVAGTWHFYAHRERFRTAEVRETIYEELDSEDDLPPPEGFPVAH